MASRALIDLDWFADLTRATTGWRLYKARKYFEQGYDRVLGGGGAGGPFADCKERVAVDAARKGLSFHDLFPPSLMKQWKQNLDEVWSHRKQIKNVRSYGWNPMINHPRYYRGFGGPMQNPYGRPFIYSRP